VLVGYCPDCGRSFRHCLMIVISLMSLPFAGAQGATVSLLLLSSLGGTFVCMLFFVVPPFQVSDYFGVLSSKRHASSIDYSNINHLRGTLSARKCKQTLRFTSSIHRAASYCLPVRALLAAGRSNWRLTSRQTWPTLHRTASPDTTCRLLLSLPRNAPVTDFVI
jgi:hypothetical protein